MKLLAFILAALAGIWLLQSLFVRKAKAGAVGRSAESLRELVPAVDGERCVLVYFHSPGCAPCKSMLPTIRELESSTGRVFELDVSQHQQEARAMGIRVTPTTLCIHEHKVAAILIGSQSKSTLLAMLEDKQ